MSRSAPADPTPTASAPAPVERALSGSPPEPGAAPQEQWLTELAREPDWSLQTPAGAPAVDPSPEETALAEPPPEEPAGVKSWPEGPAVVEWSPEETVARAEDAGALQDDARAGEADLTELRHPADPRSQELEEALAWGEQGSDAADPRAEPTPRAEIDEAAWPYLDEPVDEFGFPVVTEDYEQLFSGRHGAQPASGAASSRHAAEPGSAGAPPMHDPERIARVLQTLADQVRAGALRLPGEVDRADEAVVLAATLTALLSRNRE